MKLLLCKNIDKLGIVGDVVDVAPGYARNCLLPLGLATEPTEVNMRTLAEARRAAEMERARKRTELEALAEKMQDAEVTIRARANEEGALYGSVGVREIADALAEEEFYVKPEQIDLDRPIRHLDTITVEVKLADDLRTSVKVWVVPDKAPEEEGAEESNEDREPSTEAGENGNHAYG